MQFFTNIIFSSFYMFKTVRPKIGKRRKSLAKKNMRKYFIDIFHILYSGSKKYDNLNLENSSPFISEKNVDFTLKNM